MKCWNCAAETHGQLFCPGCGKIAPRTPGLTHFDLFGLPRSMRVDTDALERQFRELSLKLHPDRYAQADARERRLSLEQTTALNDAVKTLKDPVRRAMYLLKLHGVDLERDDAPANRDMPLDFLEEVMELREQLHHAREAGDLERAIQMGEAVARMQKAALEQATDALGRVDQGIAPEAALQDAVHALAKVRYFARFLEEVSAIEEEALST